MGWSSILAELPKAVPTLMGALVGGFLAGGVSVITQYLTHRFTRTRDHERLLREKTEELIGALDQFPDWVTVQSRQTDYQVPSPLNRAHVLQKLYFPQLAPHFCTIRKAALPILHLLVRLSPQPADAARIGLQPLSIQEREGTKLEMVRLLQLYLKEVESTITAILATPLWKSVEPFPRLPRHFRPSKGTLRPLSEVEEAQRET